MSTWISGDIKFKPGVGDVEGYQRVNSAAWDLGIKDLLDNSGDTGPDSIEFCGDLPNLSETVIHQLFAMVADIVESAEIIMSGDSECKITVTDGVLHRADARTVYDLNQQDINLTTIQFDAGRS
jgi:hypothetical protein